MRRPKSTASSAGDGRVLIRPSGTEPVVRVMVEAAMPISPDAAHSDSPLRSPEIRRHTAFAAVFVRSSDADRGVTSSVMSASVPTDLDETS